MPDSLRPLPPGRFDYAAARHLLERAGFGGPPSEVRDLADLGLDDAVASLVDRAARDAPPVAADRFDRDIVTPLSPQERRRLREARARGDEAAVEAFRRRRQETQRADRRQMREIRRWWLDRMITTARPLVEKMTLFWHGHFATGYRAIEDSYHMFAQNRLFRAHAVGSFRTLAHGVIRDPALLRYLDNHRNRKRRPNENLARELMELFTLGEGHGYSEQDVREAARALTGYTFRDDGFVGVDSPLYRRRHDDGIKRILGRSGRFDGDDLVELLLSRRACSEFICLKLYRFFVHDLPGGPDEPRRRFIVDLAAELRRHDYRLAPVLATLFRSAHFHERANVGARIKSPIQLIVQAIRALRAPARDPDVLLEAADLMGQSLFQPPSVAGWAGGRSWITTSTLFVRQNVLAYLLTGRRPDRPRRPRHPEPYDALPLVSHLRPPSGAVDCRDAVTYLLRVNLAVEPHPQRVEALVGFAERGGRELDNETLVAVLALITAMPEYQLC